MADKSNTEADLKDALMLLRMFMSRKNMISVNCLKLKAAEWMKRKGYEPTVLREEQS